MRGEELAPREIQVRADFDRLYNRIAMTAEVGGVLGWKTSIRGGAFQPCPSTLLQLLRYACLCIKSPNDQNILGRIQ